MDLLNCLCILNFLLSNYDLALDTIFFLKQIGYNLQQVITGISKYMHML